MAKNQPTNGQVRIIAGQWRSRRLPIPDLEGLRPTTDRVKETLFNWLAGNFSMIFNIFLDFLFINFFYFRIE